MRSDLPAAVAAAIERARAPALVFDRARIEATAARIATAARASKITVLFAAKSFPHPVVRELVATQFDGFDVASVAELDEVPTARVISIADPTGRAGEELARRVAATKGVRAARLIVSCETPEQVRAAPPNAELAFRLSPSLTGRDPAIGAIQDGSGHRRSRFGLDVDPARRATMLAELSRAARLERHDDRPIGLHLHHGPVTATSIERFIATATAALAAAQDADVQPRFLNLGGAWHGIAELEVALRALRAAVPANIELIIEPGRALTDEAGFACGRVCVARALDDRDLRVIDLSRICHLRWSHVDLVGNAPRPVASGGTGGRKVQLVGPTCFEDDVIGEFTIEESLAVGERVILRNVSGYAVAWNCGFHGVPPADVIVA